MMIKADRSKIANPQKTNLSIFIICFLCLSFHLSAQNTIRGRIIDADRIPIDLATVYINGTTTGAVTDQEGAFEFTTSCFPCELVISHLNYKIFNYRLESKPEKRLNIILQPQNYKIDSIEVVGKNYRAENMHIFKANFIGSRDANNPATILNEDQIVFEREYKTHSILVDKSVPNWREKYSVSMYDITWANDSSEVLYHEGLRVIARCKVPLQILVPALGYSIQYDLQQFIYTKNGIGFEECFYFGYSFFKEIKDTKKVRRLRNKAYYNSPQHFCRSLYYNTLASNGYQLLCKNNTGSLVTVNLSPQINYEENVARLINSGHSDFYILCNMKLNGDMLDLTKKTPKEYATQSRLFLNNDTCLFTNKGIIPYNDMTFSGAIGNKRIGAMLPIDFEPYSKEIISSPIFVLPP